MVTKRKTYHESSSSGSPWGLFYFRVFRKSVIPPMDGAERHAQRSRETALRYSGCFICFQDIIFNTNIKLDKLFKFALCQDVTKVSSSRFRCLHQRLFLFVCLFNLGLVSPKSD